MFFGLGWGKCEGRTSWKAIVHGLLFRIAAFNI